MTRQHEHDWVPVFPGVWECWIGHHIRIEHLAEEYVVLSIEEAQELLYKLGEILIEEQGFVSWTRPV